MAVPILGRLEFLMNLILCIYKTHEVVIQKNINITQETI